MKTTSDGVTTRTLSNNEIILQGGRRYDATSANPDNYIVEKRCLLDLREIADPDGNRTFQFVLTYMGARELDIEPGRSLELVVDANSMVFSAKAKAAKHRDPSGQYFTEILEYPVSGDRLMRMAEAETIELIVSGHHGEARGFFDDKNFANLRWFVDECVTPARGADARGRERRAR